MQFPPTNSAGASWLSSENAFFELRSDFKSWILGGVSELGVRIFLFSRSLRLPPLILWSMDSFHVFFGPR